MKVKNIIYGVDGMLEYQALINVGEAKMKIPFTNGSTNEAGRMPATFRTSNPVVQMAIENSNEFKKGFIRKVHEALTGDDVYIESEHVALAKSTVAEHPTVNEAGKQAEQTVESKEEPEAEKIEPQKDEAQTVETVTTKEFSCNDDAKDFFETEFGIKRSSMRTRADITSVGLAHGIEVKFTD